MERLLASLHSVVVIIRAKDHASVNSYYLITKVEEVYEMSLILEMSA